jgi:hypothetical protein
MKKILDSFNSLPTHIRIMIYTQTSMWLGVLATYLTELPALVSIPLATLINIALWYLAHAKDSVDDDNSIG